MTNAFANPPVDILESEADYLVALDLPGVQKENTYVQIADGRLTVEAKRDSNGSALSYRRVFQLDAGLDEAGMTAEMNQGVLVIRVPKSAEKKPLSIPVTLPS